MELNGIGLRMKSRREELGLTLLEAGKRIGCSASVVRAWERGDIKSLKTNKLQIIAKALDTTVEYLLGIEKVYVPSADMIPVDESEGDLGTIMKDDSMINARIWPDDIVYIRRNVPIDNGDLIVGDYKGITIVRRFYRYDNRIELRSENPMFPTINIEGPDVDNFTIIGKAVAIYGEIK